MRKSTARLVLSLSLSLPLMGGGPAVASAAPGPVSAPYRAELPGFADLTERLLPVVVNVSISATLKPAGKEGSGPDESAPDGPQIPPFAPDSPLRKFFHDYMKRKAGSNHAPRHVQALGSGFIIDPSGVIVTNNHVIADADQVTVTLHDGTELPAKIVGRDSRVDLAVLEVKPSHPLPAAKLGHSDAARIGDWVLAIGNPFGLSGTVTAGIISSRGRNVEHGLYDDFIQTDAAINRGNSGGPLFNLAGEVIGINTLIYGGSGGDSIGIGFAIPSDDASGIIDQLRRTGRVSRGWLGVKFQDVTRDMADDLEFRTADGQPGKGAILSTIDPKGPAAKAGLQVGDIITRVEGRDVTGRTMPRIVAASQPETKIRLDLWRKGKRLTVPLTLARSPEEPDVVRSDTHLPAHRLRKLGGLGLSVAVIDAEARTQYGLSDDQRGVLVRRVEKTGPAASRGLAEGDVILQVGEAAVDTPDAFEQAVRDVQERKKPEILLLVQDQEGLRWVPVPFFADDGD